MSTVADLAALGYTVETEGPVAAVRGFGVATMLDTDDQAAIDSLADPATHAERRFQFTQPAAAQARAALEAAGYTVERVDPSSDTFTVTAPAPATTGPLAPVAAPATMTPTDLETAAGELDAAIDPAPVSTTPPPPTPLGG